MSWTIIDDEDTLHIRAIITNRDELKSLVEKLRHKLAGHEGNITSTSDATLHMAGDLPNSTNDEEPTDE